MNMQTNETSQLAKPPAEPHTSSTKKLNWLRASVLGANDGIVSIAGLVVGVAGATTSSTVILMAGIAGVVAGAISMAAGEYVSVSSQRDSEKALIDQEAHEVKHSPDAELAELQGLYEAKGLRPETAQQVAEELTAHDALGAHLDAEHRLDPDNLTNPWHAAIASAGAFLAGAVIPMVAVIVAPSQWKVLATFLAVIVALIITGSLSAHVGGASKKRAVIRVVSGGALAMIVTYVIGRLVGVSGL